MNWVGANPARIAKKDQKMGREKMVVVVVMMMRRATTTTTTTTMMMMIRMGFYQRDNNHVSKKRVSG